MHCYCDPVAQSCTQTDSRRSVLSRRKKQLLMKGRLMSGAVSCWAGPKAPQQGLLSQPYQTLHQASHAWWAVCTGRAPEKQARPTLSVTESWRSSCWMRARLIPRAVSCWATTATGTATGCLAPGMVPMKVAVDYCSKRNLSDGSCPQHAGQKHPWTLQLAGLLPSLTPLLAPFASPVSSSQSGCSTTPTHCRSTEALLSPIAPTPKSWSFCFASSLCLSLAYA